MQRLIASIVLFFSVAAFATASEFPDSAKKAMNVFIEDMHTRHGFDAAQLRNLFARASWRPQVIRAHQRPAESLPWFKYRPRFVAEKSVRGGVEFWEQNRDLLFRVTQRYGVPAEILIAIIGVETRYGAHTGGHPVLATLATLGFGYPRRSEFYSRQLEQFLLLCRDEGLQPLALEGSYAGALGVPQFIPSSYRDFSVDFDHDGVRDLFGNLGDVLASVSNYLVRNGWDREQTRRVTPASADGGYRELLSASGEPDHRVVELRGRGIRAGQPLADDDRVALIALEGESREQLYLVHHNFYVITRYNHSLLYAMAVHQLAERIREEFQRSS